MKTKMEDGGWKMEHVRRAILYPLSSILLLLLTGCASTGDRTLHYRVPPVEYEQHSPDFHKLPMPDYFQEPQFERLPNYFQESQSQQLPLR